MPYLDPINNQPLNLVAVPVSDSSVTLTWAPPASGLDMYIYRRARGTTAWTYVEYVAGGVGSYPVSQFVI